MKKRLIPLICIYLISISILSACTTASEDFLSFEDSAVSVAFSTDTLLTKADYFSDGLVIVTEEENSGEDANLDSGASLLINRTDKELIYADNVYDRFYPASLTKLMTALVVLKHGELTDSVTISYNASHITEPGAKLCGFKEGDIIPLEALLKSLLIYSGNDAAVAIADHMSGSVEAFVRMMNEEAGTIGAVHTNFVNPSGLHDDNQYTTAYDIYLMFNELLGYDTFRSIIATDSYTASYQDMRGNSIEKTFQATNQYLTGKSELPQGLTAIGGKTGTTRKAGNCLVLLSKDSADKEYISVILKAANSETLYDQMSYLMSFAVK